MSKRKSHKPTAAPGEGVTQDGAGAWLVCLGSHLGEMLSPGVLLCLGILCTEWEKDFHSSAHVLSWVIEIPWLVACPLCPLIGGLAPRLGIRRVIVLGNLLNGCATILASFSTGVWQLYVCSAMSGVAMAMIVPPGMTALARHFKKHYALSIGLSFLGVSVSRLPFPPLMRWLIASYGWRGAILVFGAAQLLNGVVACVLYRPLNTQSDRRRSGGTEGKSSPRRPSWPTFLTVVVFGLLAMYCSTAALAMIGTHFPGRARSVGLLDDQVHVVSTVCGIALITSRLLHGWFVDRKYVDAFKLQLVTLLGASLLTFLSLVADGYLPLLGYGALIGACLGILSPMMLFLVKTLVRESDGPTAFGSVNAVFLLAIGTGSKVADQILEMTGNYTTVFLCAASLFIAAFSLVAVVVAILRPNHAQDVVLAPEKKDS